MLNRSQWITLFGLARRGERPIPYASRDIRQHLVKTNAACFNPEIEIADLLSFIAYGNLAAAKKMLDANPRLVLLAGHADTPSGLNVQSVGPLECALGAGDPEMVAMIAPYFDQFDGGAKVREDQYARYRQHVEDMLNAEKNPPYDFGLLIETLLASSLDDVEALLRNDMTHESVLRDVFVQFRKDFTPGVNTHGMHFNYLHLLHACEVYDKYFKELAGDARLRLFSRQVIGFIQRSLPAIDRMAFAEGIFGMINRTVMPRSFRLKLSDISFPVTAGDAACDGLGFDCWLLGAVTMEGYSSWQGAMSAMAREYRQLLQKRHDRLAELAGVRGYENSSWCVIC